MSNNSKSLLKPSFYMGTTKAEPSGWFNTINEARCLNTMIKPISLYATMSTMGLVAIKYILSNSVIDQTDKVPFMDDTKVFGVFLNFIPGIIMASFYAKKKLWFNPHMDYMLLATPIIALGPLLWSLTRKSLIEASYQIILPTCLLPTFLNPLLYWNDELGLTALIRLCALQSLVYYLMVSYNL
ncbi:hypothetical protein BC829DRAFT_177513 [Chytridium lagenaria]|nr:hypothetical protein BC829DRAFT_177513 [Chytridium lagenaria]